MSKGDKVHGEGNYEASRQYNQATKRFVEAGKVDEAARDAAPANPTEERELQRAEDAGRERAKEEDPALKRSTRSKPPGDQDTSQDKTSAGLRPGFGGSNENGTEQSRAKTSDKE